MPPKEVIRLEDNELDYVRLMFAASKWHGFLCLQLSNDYDSIQVIVPPEFMIKLRDELSRCIDLGFTNLDRFDEEF